MLTRADLEIIQQEAKRQFTVAEENTRIAGDARTEIANELRPLEEQLRGADLALRGTEPLIPRWGKAADGSTDPERPMLKKDIDAKLLEHHTKRDALAKKADTLKAKLAKADAALAAATQEKMEIAAALTQIDAAIRATPA